MGLGIVLKLHDNFSKQAVRIERQMKMMGATSDDMLQRMDRSMHAMSAGLGTMAVGAGLLATLAFPLRDAINFEHAITGTLALVEDKAAITREEIEKLASSLSRGTIFNPLETAEAIKSTVAAGIEDVNKAGYFVDVALRGATVTDSSVDDYTSLLLSAAQGYDFLNPMYTNQQIEANAKHLGEVVFKAVTAGRFSDAGGVTDLAAAAKQSPKLFSQGNLLGISFEETMAMFTAATLGGQNAQRAATGIQQMYSDLMNLNRNPNRTAPFVAHALSEGVDLTNARGEVDIANFNRTNENGWQQIMATMRSYVQVDQSSLQSLMANTDFRERYDTFVSNVEAGLIDGSQGIESSAEAVALINEMGAVGAIDASKMKQIFQSIWGFTAAGPLLGVQYNKVQSLIEDFRADTSRLEIAYAESMTSVKNQWARLMGNIMGLNIIWGGTLLEPVASTLNVINLLVQGLAALSARMEGLIAPLLSVMAHTGIFLASLGAYITAAGGLSYLNDFIMKNAQEAGVLSRFLGGTLATAMYRITILTLAFIATQKLLSMAWDSNFGGMTDVITRWVERVLNIFDAVREVFTNMDWATGMSTMSMETHNALKRLGVLEFTYKLIAVLYRLGMFIRGFSSGFSNVMRAYKNMVQDMLQGLADGLGVLKILPKVQAWLESLYDPTRDNVEAFRQFGVTIGRIAAGITLLGAVLGIAATFAILGNSLWTLNGGFRGLLLDIIPLLKVFGGLAAIGWLVKSAFEGNWFGFADMLERRVPRLAYIVDNFGAITRSFRENLEENGLRAAVRSLSFDLIQMYPDEALRATRDRLVRLGEAIRRFPNEVRSQGFQLASLHALQTMFGEEQGAQVYINIARMFTRIRERLVAEINFLRAIPTLISTLGWSAAFDAIFTTAFQDLRVQAMRGFSGILAEFFMFIGEMGWSGHWFTLSAAFSTQMAEMERRWGSLRTFFATVWNDLKTKVDWDLFFATAASTTAAFFTLSAWAWDQFIAGITTGWNALVNDVDWAAIQFFIDDLSASLMLLSSGQGFNWDAIFGTAIDTVNILITSLQTALDLLQALANPTDMSLWGDVTESQGKSMGQMLENPLAGFAAFLIIDLLLTKIIKLGKGIGGAASKFTLLHTAIKLSRRLALAMFNQFTSFVTVGQGWKKMFTTMTRVVKTAFNTMTLRAFLFSQYMTATLLPVIRRVGIRIGAILAASFGWPGLIVLGLTAIILGAIWAWQTNFMGFKTKIISMWEGLRDNTISIFSGIGTTISNAFNGALDSVFRNYNRVANFLNGLLPTTADDLPLYKFEEAPAAAPANSGGPKPFLNGGRDMGPGPLAATSGYSYTGSWPGAGDSNNTEAPNFNVAGFSSAQNDRLNSLLKDAFLAAQGPNSESGSVVTASERAQLTTTLETLISLIQDGIHVESTVKIDEREIGRASSNRSRRVRQTGGGFVSRH